MVSFREETAGRETLAAIAEARVEQFHPLAHRAPASTQHYGDRISNAPGAVSPKTQRALDDAPDVSVSFLPAGRETSAAIDFELHGDGPLIEVHDEVEEETEFGEFEESSKFEVSRTPEVLAVQKLSIEQQHTFIVRTQSQRLRTPSLRRALLETRLLPTLPGLSFEDVTKIVVEAHGEEASIVRFWTRVG